MKNDPASVAPSRWAWVIPDASPRRIVRFGFLMLFAGIVVLVAALDAGAGPEIVTWPMLLAGLGIGALASQLGSVTASAVPDEQSGEVGGLQNTVTNLGASIGTALAGAVLISVLTSSVLTGIQSNPDVPEDLSSQAQVELAGGVPFISGADLEKSLSDAGVPSDTAHAIVDENADFRIDGLRSALAVPQSSPCLHCSSGVPFRARNLVPNPKPTGGKRRTSRQPDGCRCKQQLVHHPQRMMSQTSGATTVGRC